MRRAWIVSVVQRGEWFAVLRADGSRDHCRRETVDGAVSREGMAVAWDEPQALADGRTAFRVRAAA